MIATRQIRNTTDAIIIQIASKYGHKGAVQKIPIPIRIIPKQPIVDELLSSDFLSFDFRHKKK